jgi:glyoxylase-like metal-dependent hydrolase (beta-lactamase superfamily II)
MKMWILHNGSMFLDESSLVAGINNASVLNQNPTARWVEIPVMSCLISLDGGGYALFDTGCNAIHAAVPGVDMPSPFVYRDEQLLPARLSQLGVSPDEVKYVVISHLHSDHAGYLYLFKNAEIILSDAEFTQSLRLYGLRGFGEGPYKSEDFESFLSAKLDWRLIPDGVREYPVAPGLTAVNFGPGHTFGMTGLLVELPESGNFLLCADALYRSENLGPPIRVPGLIYDSIGYEKSARFIADYATSKGARIVFGHDMRQFGGLVTSEDGWYA